MNRTHRLSILFLIIMILSGCDLLDGPKPEGAVDIQDLGGIGGNTAFLNGVYDGLQHIDFGELLYYNDSMTDFVSSQISFPNSREITYQSMTSNNTTVEGIWNQLYKGINETNIVIENVKKIQNAPQSQKENILGQAHFLRALMYYYLVQYFAKPWNVNSNNSQLGVPLRLNPVNSTSDFENNTRASVKEVYNQIIKDLNEANGLTISNESPAKATNNAATALQARIALIQERWDDAAKFAGKVIPNYSLSADVADFFQNELGPECIFVIANLTNDRPGNGALLSSYYNRKARAGAMITDDYKDALKNIVTDKQKAGLKGRGQKAVDTRVTELLATGAEPPLTINKYSYTNKYEDFSSQADNNPVFRLSEMILTRAEALAELNGINKESINLLNKIRVRAIKVETQNGDAGDESLIEYTTDDFQNRNELVNVIFLERSVELSFEGHRKTDLQRRKLGVRDTPWDANKLVFPIPQSQTDVSDIQQNPGY